MSKTIADWAEYYTKNLGFHLVPIEPNRKYPRSSDWGNKTVSDPALASGFYAGKPDWNMGAALHQSRICSLDVDCIKSFDLICEAFGIDSELLKKEHPTIQGSLDGYRIMFRVPKGVELPYVKLNWRPESDPTGVIHRDLIAQARDAKESGDFDREADLREEAKKHAMYTVFELRSATDGTQKQDVLPPSWHPEANKRYEWITPPNNTIPEPPEWLLTIWTEFKEKFELQFKMACPWADADEVYEKKARNAPQQVAYNGSGGFMRVVDEFNRQADIETTLQNYGYKRVSNKRWLSPYSHTGLPGVTIFSEGNKCWIHHASDPLCSDSTGRPVAPFDLLCCYDHNGDFKNAVVALAEQMGMSTHTPERNAQPKRAAEHVKPAEGEIAPVEFIDTFTLLPHTVKDKPIKHHENLAEIIRRLGMTVRYNVIKKEEELIVPGETFSQDNAANASYAYLTSMCSLFNFATDKNQEFLTYLADKNQYNPAKEFLEAVKWDGKDRLTELCNTIQVSENEWLRDALIKRWLLSAVEAAVSPAGVAAQGILVLQGGQGLGKTAWFKRLIPTEVNRKEALLQDGLLVKPDDKDSVRLVTSFWLVELGELDATFSRSGQSQLKAFTTRDTDELRLPYARKESKFARRTVFFGSVNPREFLHDDTGNRRYWTIEAKSINNQHDIDMYQLWAQIYHMHQQGESHVPNAEEYAALNESNEQYLAVDPIEERILSNFDWDAPRHSWDYLQTTDVLIKIGVDRPTRSDTTKAGQILRKLNGGDAKRMGGKRLLSVPPKIYF